MLKMSYTSFHVLSSTFLKLRTAFSVRKFPRSSPVRLLIPKLILALDEAFEKDLCITSQTGYLQGMQQNAAGTHATVC